MDPVLDDDFPAALRAAISARGLSLEKVRRQLAQRGVRVSVATLSYWQTGRSRPERTSSFAAVGHLEEILAVPRGFLAGRLTPRRPGAPALTSAYQPPEPLTDTIGQWGPAMQALHQLGLDGDDGLERISIHDRIRLRADGTEETHQVRTVFRAVRDGADRFGVWYDRQERESFPIVRPETNCSLGRLVELRDDVGVAAEVLLDRPLRAGESVVVEHRLESLGDSEPQTHFARGFGGSVRELVIEVAFHHLMPPVAAHEVTLVDECESVRELAVANPLQMLVLDAEPGSYGLQWCFDAGAPARGIARAARV